MVKRKGIKTGGKKESGNRPSMRQLKTTVTRMITTARLVAEAGEESVRNPGVREDAENRMHDVEQQLVALESIPRKIEQSLQENFPASTLEANRAVMETHLESRGWAELKYRLARVLEELRPVREPREDEAERLGDAGPPIPETPILRQSQTSNRERGFPPIGRDTSNRESGLPPIGRDTSNREREGLDSTSEEHDGHHRSSSTMDTPEFGDMLTRRINYIQDTQHLMMERLNAQEDRIKVELVKRDNQMMLFEERVTKSFRDVQDGMKALQVAYNDLREDSRAERATLLNTIKNDRADFMEKLKEVMRKDGPLESPVRTSNHATVESPPDLDSPDALPEAFRSDSPLPPPQTSPTVPRVSSPPWESPSHNTSSPSGELPQGLPAIMPTGLSPPAQEKSSPMLTTNLVNSILGTIKPFDGNNEDYPLFRQMFMLMVHENEDIQVALKQSLLLRLLTGEALAMMKSPRISPEDYQTLLDNLDRQYNKEQMTEQYYMELLMKHTFSEDSYDEMEKELNRFCSLVNILRNKGVNPDDPMFLKCFINRLPQKIMAPVYRKHHEKRRGFQELVEIAYSTIIEKKAIGQAREEKKQSLRTNEIYAVSANRAKTDNPHRPNSDSRNWRNDSHRPVQSGCKFCKSKDHLTGACTWTVDEKRDAIRSTGRCYNCLGAEHRVVECPSSLNCGKCKGRHHTLLCKKPSGVAKEEPKKPAAKPFFRTKGAETSDSDLKIVDGSVSSNSPESPVHNRCTTTTSVPCVIDTVLQPPPITIQREDSPGPHQHLPVLWDHEEHENNGDSCQVFTSRIIDPADNLPFLILKDHKDRIMLALVDSGATTTILSLEAAEQFKLPTIGEKTLTFTGFVSDSKPERCQIFEVNIKDRNGEIWTTQCVSYHRMNIRFVAPTIAPEDMDYLETLGVDTDELRRRKRFDGVCIDMILGNNILGHIRREQWRLPSGRVVDHTIFGDVVYPPITEGALVPQGSTTPRISVVDTVEGVHMMVMKSTSTDCVEQLEHEFRMDCVTKRPVSNYQLDKQLERSWNLEILGLEPPENVAEKNKINEELIEQFKKTAIRDESGRIHVALPFNGRERDLSDNYPVAATRLTKLLKNNINTYDLRREYDKIIKQQLESGIIEEVVEDMNSSEPIFYIPHTVVIKEDSLTTKLRIVLDASSHMKDENSLNDCLHAGPSILQPIVGILLRTRLSKYMIISDIEKAFHQVRIQSEFRNVTRFLWIRDITKEPKGDNVVTYRFTRLPFGMSCSPFLLAITILLYLDMAPAEINNQIVENLYVDNVLLTTNNAEELRTMYSQLKNTFRNMHMNLREFLCNDEEVMESIPKEDKLSSATSKLLGHVWNSEDDTIGIKIPSPPEGIPTKREIVAFSAQIYDPTGLVSPLGVLLKKLISLLWTLEVKWNEKVPAQLIPMWKGIAAQFSKSIYTIPRQIVSSYDYKAVKLVLFSDASMDHYATAAYLRFAYADGSVQSKLIYSKSRIKPSKSEITIPQMELLGLECATNAAITLHQELHLDIEQIVFFCDSTCVLFWVLHKVSSHIGLRWAANRVAKVKTNLGKLAELQLNPSVRYVPTDQNPADIASRGCTLDELKHRKLWHHGPDFLGQSEENWPHNLNDTPADPREFRTFTMGNDRGDNNKDNTVCSLVIGQSKVSSSIVPYRRTNSLKKLTTVMSYTFRFLSKCVEKRNNRFPHSQITFTSRSLDKFYMAHKTKEYVESRKIARLFIIVDHYSDAKNRMALEPPPQFHPILTEEGVYRHRRPFSNSEHPGHNDEMKSPIIIIHKHELARLIVQESHTNLRHEGVKNVVCDVQRRYWILKIGHLVKSVRDRCVTCRRIHAPPFQYPYAEFLPPIRSQIVAPFAFIGLDYFGPLYYKSSEGKGKIWVLLVTCIVTRAIHLEIVQNNTTYSFVTSLGRVFARRGVPQTILSDNAPTFKLGYSIINTDIRTLANKSATLTSYLADREIDIKLITPFSPWQGGIYERLVGLVKNMIVKILGPNVLSLLELESLLIESEGILNSRPITPNQQDLVDSAAIRPIDYLIPNTRLVIPGDHTSVVDTIKTGDTEKLTRKLLASTNAVREKLWNFFSEEYFLFLRKSANRAKAHSKLKPAVGQVVLVPKDLVKRHKWPIGLIKELITSSDGKVRSVMVKVGKNVVERSVNQLIPLEVPNEFPTPSEDTPERDQLQEFLQSAEESSHPASQHKLGHRKRPYLHRKAKE
ncbi:hypothetical protein CAEBREN_32382, partial [Caenorhabditis brenneri]